MFKIEFEVRDNELDAQGVVNNSNYFIYMAHARHKYLHSIGLNFDEMAKANQNFFLTKSTIEFKSPLKANDVFYVTCNLIPEGSIRLGILQEIRLAKDDTLIASASNIGCCINGNNKRPYIPEEIKKVFNTTI